MKLLPLLILLLLTITLHLIFYRSIGSSAVTLLKAGRSLKENLPTIDCRNGQKNIKVPEKDVKQTPIQEEPMEQKYISGGDNPNELIYHVDYHGVATHPTPTPKHPRP